VLNGIYFIFQYILVKDAVSFALLATKTNFELINPMFTYIRASRHVEMTSTISV